MEKFLKILYTNSFKVSLILKSIGTGYLQKLKENKNHKDPIIGTR